MLKSISPSITMLANRLTQPYHAVIDTPGSGWTIRCNSKKFLEDGLFEIAVAPYGELAATKPVTLGGPNF